jgi:hypothetical protein
MKTQLLLAAVTTLAFGAGCAANHPAKTAAAEDKVLLTGSAIPQKVERSGTVVKNSASPVRILDKDAPENAGARDAGEILRRNGVDR